MSSFVVSAFVASVLSGLIPAALGKGWPCFLLFQTSQGQTEESKQGLQKEDRYVVTGANGNPAGAAGQKLGARAPRGPVAAGALLARGKRPPKNGLSYSVVLVEALVVFRNRNRLFRHSLLGRCEGSRRNPQVSEAWGKG